MSGLIGRRLIGRRTWAGARGGAVLGLIALGAGVIGTALGGCAAVKKSDYDAAVAENAELRQRLEEEAAARREADTRNSSLEQEHRDMSGALDRGAGRGDPTIRGEGITTSRGPNGELVVQVAGDVLFDSGSVVIKAAGKRSLDSVASAIKSGYSTNLIRVEGYTDADPIRKSKWETNERLSSERALAVEKYLVSKGVNNSQIYSAAFGSARPKPTKKDSRRVEIVILAARN